MPGRPVQAVDERQGLPVKLRGWFLLPLVLILLLAAMVMVGTRTVPGQAPFFYVAF